MIRRAFVRGFVTGVALVFIFLATTAQLFFSTSPWFTSGSIGQAKSAITGFLLPDGTATVPALGFLDDPDTGLFSSANGAIDMTIDGTNLYRWSGVGVEFSSRSINNPNEVGFSATTFAGLGTPSNGRIRYCSDCTIANPCAGAGTGALAKRLNAIWVCN